MRHIIAGVAGGCGAALLFVSACSAAELAVRPQPITWGSRKVETLRTIDTVVIHTLYNPWANNRFSRAAILRILKYYGVASLGTATWRRQAGPTRGTSIGRSFER